MTFPGPSRTIIVEPVEVPKPAEAPATPEPAEAPEPDREKSPAETPEPEKVPVESAFLPLITRGSTSSP